MMLKIGITGGIGSGKTTISKLFELLKIPVFYADIEARNLMNTDPQLLQAIKLEFGPDIYHEDGLLNRTKLAALVFNDVERLKKLNSLVHPAVFNAFFTWVKLQEAPYLLKEAALLYESGSYKDCDMVILVKSPLNLKISRIMKRDSISEAEVIKRIEKQWSDEEKEKLADYIINNDEQQFLIPQVMKLHETILKKSGSFNDT